MNPGGDLDPPAEAQLHPSLEAMVPRPRPGFHRRPRAAGRRWEAYSSRQFTFSASCGWGRATGGGRGVRGPFHARRASPGMRSADRRARDPALEWGRRRGATARGKEAGPAPNRWPCVCAMGPCGGVPDPPPTPPSFTAEREGGGWQAPVGGGVDLEVALLLDSLEALVLVVGHVDAQRVPPQRHPVLLRRLEAGFSGNGGEGGQGHPPPDQNPTGRRHGHGVLAWATEEGRAIAGYHPISRAPITGATQIGRRGGRETSQHVWEDGGHESSGGWGVGAPSGRRRRSRTHSSTSWGP